MAFEELQDMGWYFVLALAALVIMIIFFVAFKITLKTGWTNSIWTALKWIANIP